MAKRDFYDVLGVPRDASPDALKQAYRRQAKSCHPDRNPGDAAAEQKFKDVSEAYDILKDEQSRAAYDQFGHGAFDGTGNPSGGPFGGPFGGRGHGGFDSHFSGSMSDIFSDLFGGFSGARRDSSPSRGADLRYDLSISLKDAHTGTRQEIRLPASVSCDGCLGSGAADGTSAESCATCGGAGSVRSERGFFTLQRTCPACMGRGRHIPHPCMQCQGRGRVEKTRSLTVTIPPGVEDGTRLRLSGEGDAGMNSAPAGDLYIFPAIRPHALFQRHGADLLCPAPLSMTVAALGGTLDVPTIDGETLGIKIPAGTNGGKRFRLRDKGMAILNTGGRRGDLYVEVAIETPQHLSRQQKKLLQEFAKTSNAKNHPESRRFAEHLHTRTEKER